MNASLSFRDPDLPLSARLDDLVGRLALTEKVRQLLHENPAIPRLDLPAYNWWNEACHGVGRNGRATVFPQVIGLAATWNRQLIHACAVAIADEARAKHHAAVAADQHGQYQGLTFWTPNVNIFRDPRWGRGQETFGEDPFLTGELGQAMVRGLQGEDPRYLKTAACAKHFAVHSGPERSRHGFDARPSPKDLAETYLPAFKSLVDAGVEAVMGAYNRVWGEPACASRLLLQEILREQWKFRGHVVSDCGAIDDFHRSHGLTRNASESAVLALNAGCDLNCGCTYGELVLALAEGKVAEAQIDLSLRRLLATKFRLGLFDPPERVPFAATSVQVIDSAAHRELARQAAVESIVLLKNQDETLPLPRHPGAVLVVGPNAGTTSVLLGNYHGLSGRLVTLLEGIAAQLPEGVPLEYRQACPLLAGGDSPDNYAFVVAEQSAVVIAIMGLDPAIEGEEGDASVSAAGGDRLAIELPANQRAFLRELRRHAKKLILVVTGGSAIALTAEHEFCDAILQVWYPGCEGGTALAQILWGAASPSGKLPVTVPRRTEDLPPFEDYAMRGRTYRFAEIPPLYPFGFGLSYGKLQYGPLQLSTDWLAEGESLQVDGTLHNLGGREVLETAQLYLIPPTDWPEAPRAILIGFDQVLVPANGQAPIRLSIPAERFFLVDASGKPCRVLGRYRLSLGSASPGPRASELGAPAAVASRFELV